MSSVVLKPNLQRFPVGTSVVAFAAREPVGDIGPTLETQAVAADGSLTFTTLADGNYVAYASSTQQRFNFVVAPTSTGGASSAASGTATNTSASVGTSSSSIVAANPSRKGLIIVNDSPNKVWLAAGATAAVANTGLALAPNGGSWNGKLGDVTWTGEVRAIAAAAASIVTIATV